MSKRILIVEDDMIISMVLKRMIEKLNYKIIDTLRTGADAIKTALKEVPDLILMDIQLDDDIDGIEAMKTIRAEIDVPVIYITGNSDQYNLDRAKELGYLDYMIKPIRMKDLQNALEKIED